MKKVMLNGLLVSFIGLFLFGCGQVGEQGGLGETNLIGGTISGKVTNTLSNKRTISSAVVLAGDVVGRTGADGTYALNGVDADAKTISATAANYMTTTLSKSDGPISIPLISKVSGYGLNGYSSDRIATVKGRLLNSAGVPLNASTIIDIQAISGDSVHVENISRWMIGPDGSFVSKVHFPEDIDTAHIKLLVVNNESAGNKGIIKDITVEKWSTIEAGDIIVDSKTAKISGTIAVEPGGMISGFYYGIYLNGARVNCAYQYVFAPNSYSYSVEVPAPSDSPIYYIQAFGYADKSGQGVVFKDIALDGSNAYSRDLVVPKAVDVLSPNGEQRYSSLTPVFEWRPLGDDYVYIAAVSKKEGGGWIGITKNCSIEYPSFPIGSGGESANLISGEACEFSLVAFKAPKVVMNDLDVAAFTNTAEEYIQSKYQYFIAGTDLEKAISVMSVKDELDKKMDQLLRNCGLSPK